MIFIETHYAEGYRYIGPAEEQLIQPYMVEFEKTRGVKIIIEEEEIQVAEPAAINSTLATPSLNRRTRTRASDRNGYSIGPHRGDRSRFDISPRPVTLECYGGLADSLDSGSAAEEPDRNTIQLLWV